MIVVCDSSPISYLLLIQEIDLLPELFGRVTIPVRVHRELQAESAPMVVRHWASQPPEWLVICEAPFVDLGAELYHLDAGEREALALALQLEADLILLDDLHARKVAVSLGLKITGLIGILDRAAAQGLVNLEAVVASLEETSFRISPDLLKALLLRHLSS